MYINIIVNKSNNLFFAVQIIPTPPDCREDIF